MKKAILILLLLQSLSATAQIRISDFKQLYSDGSAAEAGAALSDPDGRLCAVLKLETRQSGWTFDAGLAGIVDTRYEEGIIWLYVPASARKLTVSHKEYGVLREWSFPERLGEGRTYSMRLEVKTAPAPRHSTPAPRMESVSNYPVSGYRQMQSPARAVAPVYSADPLPSFDTDQPHGFCRNFFDLYAGLVQYNDSEYVDEVFVGLRYTRLKERVGPYFSAALSIDGCGAFFAGAALRAFSEERSDTDLQLYGGVGLVYGCALAGEAGLRFAGKSTSKTSHWDFGIGCQFWQGAVVPTVEVGLYVWGIPLLICLGLGACALGG